MNFFQFNNILKSRKSIILSTLMIIVSMTLLISLLLPKQYVATTAIIIDQRSVDPVTGLSLPVLLLPGYMATQVEVIASHNIMRKVVEKLKLNDDPQMRKDFAKAENTGDIKDWVADKLLKKLDVRPSSESSLVQINFTAKNPQLAASIANAVADAYIQTSIELRAQPAKLTADWFDLQMVTLRERLEKAQSVLSTYQKQQGIIEGVIEGVDRFDRFDIEKTRLSDLSKQLVESQARTNELQARKDLLVETLEKNGSYESLQEVLSSPLIQSLKTELARSGARLADLSQKFKKGNPQYRQAEAQVTSLQKEIKEAITMVLISIDTAVSSSKRRDIMLTKALAEQKEKVMELKKKHDQISVLSREVENVRKEYDDVAHRTVQTRMESEMSHTDISILNRALPPQNPAKPKVLLNLILAIFLGSLVGVGLVLLVESMDRRIRSAFDISEILGVPVYGVVSSLAVKPKRMSLLFELAQRWR
jgi:polysaccharide biosynthesis transport protein